MTEIALKKAKEVAQKIADELGYQLYDVKVYSELGTEFLEVSVDKDYSITLDQIEIYSNKLSEALDSIEELSSPYTLDVASPGAEREFPKEDLNKVIGYYVQVITNDVKDNEREGTIESFDGKILTLKRFIKGRKKIYEIPYESIKKCAFKIK